MVKPATTYFEQIELLRSRGCIIDSENECIDALSNIGYYRLSAYFIPFKSENGLYLNDTNFHTVYKIYEFDREMRKILFAAVEEIEVSLKSAISYYHAHRFGPLGYLDEQNFSDMHDHTRFMSHIDDVINSNRKVQFVKHHLENYDGEFPIWVIFELFTFGMLSYIFADMPTPDKKNFARSEFGTTSTNIESWLRCCTDLRNICAHYGRLYYRNFSSIPANLNVGNNRRLWSSILAVKQLFKSKDKWNNEVCVHLSALVAQYNDYISLFHIGFPENWEDLIRK